MKGKKWREAEDIILYELVGVRSFEAVAHQVRKIDAQNGWEPRSNYAIHNRIHKLGLSYRCFDDNISLRKFSQYLEVSDTTVHRWKSMGIPVRTRSRQLSQISISSAKEWFKNGRMHLVKGLSYESLLWLFNDGEIAKALSVEDNRPGREVRIQRMDTKQVFPSIRKAAASAYISESALARAARKHKYDSSFEAGGTRWRVITENQMPIRG